MKKSPKTRTKSGLQLMLKFWLSFFLGTAFFPARQRREIFAIYQAVRVPDQIVDHPDPGISLAQHSARARQILTAQHADRTETLKAQNFSHPTRGEAVRVFVDHEIPPATMDAFFHSMLLDTQQFSYDSRVDLRSYVFGSAEIVGEILTKISQPAPTAQNSALPAARHLARLFQITNFLRDIHEDQTELSRVYLPTDTLAKFWFSLDDFRATVASCRPTTEFSALVFQLSQELSPQFSAALLGLARLPDFARRPIFLAAQLYHAILTNISRHDGDVLRHSARTPRHQKLRILPRARRDFQEFSQILALLPQKFPNLQNFSTTTLPADFRTRFPELPDQFFHKFFPQISTPPARTALIPPHDFSATLDFS